MEPLAIFAAVILGVLLIVGVLVGGAPKARIYGAEADAQRLDTMIALFVLAVLGGIAFLAWFDPTILAWVAGAAIVFFVGSAALYAGYR